MEPLAILVTPSTGLASSTWSVHELVFLYHANHPRIFLVQIKKQTSHSKAAYAGVLSTETAWKNLIEYLQHY